MAKRGESRSRASQRAVKPTVELDARLELRVSSQARAMLEARAQEAGIPPAILHRQVLYRYLGLIPSDPKES